MLHWFRQLLRKFAFEREGSVLVETLIVVPIITGATIALLEVGSVFWHRQLMQTGVRDAARYWARCRPITAQFTATCSETIARNIAFYGKPNPVNTELDENGCIKGLVRVRNWCHDEDLDIEPADLGTLSSSDPSDLVVVTGRLQYSSSPLLNIAEQILDQSISPITLTYRHSERYMGW